MIDKIVYQSLLQLDGISTNGALLLGLDPLKQTLVMKQMSAGCQFPAVQELTHTDDTVLIEGSLGGPKDVVEPVQQSIIASVSADGRAEVIRRDIEGIDY